MFTPPALHSLSPDTPITFLTVGTLTEIIANAIKEYNAKNANALPEKDEMTLPEVAVFLNVVEGSVYQLVHSQGLPSTKKGKFHVFSKKAVEEWSKNRARKPRKKKKLEAQNETP